MPLTSPGSNAALITAFMTPTTNWGAVMAAKDNQLQQQQYASALAEKDVVEAQQAATRINQFQSALKSLPLEAPDQRRVNVYLTKQEKQLAQRIATEYQGDRARFWKTEGQDWMQHALGQLQTSQEYQDGEHNREQMAYIKEAVRKGENLVGDVVNKNGKQGYVPFMSQLNDYHAGKLPRITFNGSYKADDELVKHFGSQYAPNADPWTETPVGEEHKLNYLMTTDKPEVALDKYYQQYAGKAVFYKRDSLVDKAKFDMTKGQYNMAVGRDQRDRSLFGLRKEGLALSNALKQQKLAGEGAEGGGNFMGYVLGNAIDGGSHQFSTDGTKVLPHSGYDLSRFSSSQTGKAQLFAAPLYGSGMATVLAQKVGLGAYDKKNGGYAGADHIKEGFVEKNGFHAIDLANSRFKVLALDPKIFFNQRDVEKPGTDGPMGFARVQVQFDDDVDAHRAGLLNINGFDSTTKAGTGVYDKSNRQAWITVPIGSLTKDRAFGSALQRTMMGQKEANKAINYGIGLGDDSNDE